jgi:hypothetical protein
MAFKLTLAAGLLFSLSGCYDHSPAAGEPTDPVQALKKTHVREIAAALKDPFKGFESREFDRCVACCNWVLSREPEYSVALEMADAVKVVKRQLEEWDEFYFSLTMAKVQHWKEETDPDEALIPYLETLTYPHLMLPTPPDASPRAPYQVSTLKMD